MEATKWLKPSISVSRIGDSASVQAVARVNAEQSSKRTMRRPSRQPFRGRLIRLGEAERRVRPAAAPGQWRQHVHRESVRNTGSPMAWSAMTNRKSAPQLILQRKFHDLCRFRNKQCIRDDEHSP
jgi:hypothetical protein